MASFAVELRVLGLRRAVKDRLYLWWVLSLNCGVGVPFWLWDVLGLTGYRAYFEWRDDIDYPAIARFERREWRKKIAAKTE